MGRQWLISLGCLIALSHTVQAEVRLPSIFSDHAVVQCGMKVPIWGWAEPGEKVTVTVGKMQSVTQADKDGKWKTTIGPFELGAKLTLQVNGSNAITIKDVLAGEVWLCSGQSNMAMTVQRSKDFEKEKAAASHSEIRMFKTSLNPQPKPQEKVAGRWVVCSPATVGGFTATGYFFARKIHQELKCPVGLVNSSVGGTAVEAWTSMDVQRNDAKLKPIFRQWNRLDDAFDEDQAKARYQKQLAAGKEKAAKARKEGKRPPRRPRQPVKPSLDRNYPSNLYNGMIAPLIPYGIRGALWYQGERNARNVESAMLYRHQLPLLIRDWRKRWDQGAFPFYFVQLPNFKARSDDPGAESAWAVMRESMAETLKVPRTAMAITIDVGEARDIHPKNKQAVGQRLAMAALANVYEKEGVASGPLYQSHAIDGNRVVVTFDHVGNGLKVKGDVLKGFAIAGSNGKWQWAQAKVDGNKVVVWHPDIAEPKAVRYGWGDNPEVSLYNSAGLPAGPFRTDGSGSVKK